MHKLTVCATKEQLAEVLYDFNFTLQPVRLQTAPTGTGG